MDHEPPRIIRVAIENYKSIAHCDVQLQRLSFLVGPNGAGKSNFLDALRFISDALQTTWRQALDARGGFEEVVCRAPGLKRDGGRARHFSLRLEVKLADDTMVQYLLIIASPAPGEYRINAEECSISTAGVSQAPISFVRTETQVKGSPGLTFPAVAPDRLYLVNASGLPQFRPIYEALTRLAFYRFDVSAFHGPQRVTSGELLSPDGGNIASVIRHMEEASPRPWRHVQDYLARIVPGLHSVRTNWISPYLALIFHMATADHAYSEDFTAASMSEGTLRALGSLVALFQVATGSPILIVLEEPEATLHPAALGVLLDALRDASTDVQVLVSTHSPEILDSKEIDPDAVLAVISDEGVTRIGALDEADRAITRERLYTVGELMRQGPLTPDPGANAAPALTSGAR